MMLPYGITHFNLADASLARGLMRHVLSRMGVATVMEDALQVVRAYHHLTEHEAYLFRIQMLLEHQDIGAATGLFQSLPTETQLLVGPELVQWTMDSLCDPVLGFDDMRERFCNIQTALACLPPVIRAAAAGGDRVLTDQLKEWRVMLQNIYQLMLHFGVFVSVEEYQSPARRRALLDTHLDTFFSPTAAAASALSPEQLQILQQADKVYGQRVATPADSALGVAARVKRLQHAARLLDLTPAHVVDALSERSVAGRATEAELQLAVQLCQDLYASTPTPEVARVLAALASSLLAFAAQASPSTHAVGSLDTVSQRSHYLARLALKLCDNESLCDVLELTRCCELAHEVFRQCESGEYGDALRRTDGLDTTMPSAPGLRGLVRAGSDLNAQSISQARFREDGLVLDSKEAIPLAARFARAAVALAPRWQPVRFRQQRMCGRKHEAAHGSALAAVSKVAQDMFQYLSQNSLGQLGLSYAALALSLCSQHRLLNTQASDVERQFLIILPKASAVVTEMVKGLLTKVFGSKVPDRALALGYMTLLDKQVAFELFHAAVGGARRNFPRLCELTLVAQGFALLWSDQDVLAESTTLHKNALWQSRLVQWGVTFDPAQFNRDPAQCLTALLPALAARPDGTLSSLLEVVQAYELDGDTALLAFIKAAALAQDVTRVSAAARRLSRKEAVGPLLVALLDEQGPYDYTRLRVMCSLLVEHATEPERRALAERYLLVLNVLEGYARTAKPSAYELSFLENDMPASVRLTVASDAHPTRLPFHPLVHGDALRVLAPELTLTTLSQLLPLGALLQVSADALQVTLIEGLLADPATRVTFRELEPVLGRIADMETAIMAAKMVSDFYGLQSDKVAALQCAVAKAQAWHQALPAGTALKDQSQRMLARLDETYRRTETELVLKTAGLQLDALRGVLGDPTKLIAQLYEDYCLDTQREFPQVHAICQGIAQRYGLDNGVLSRQLIMKWLTQADDSLASESSAPAAAALAPTAAPARSFSLMAALEEPVEPAGAGAGSARAAPTSAAAQLATLDTNLRRAVCLLKLEPTEPAVAFLLQFVLHMEDSVSITPAARLRAFRALFAVAPSDQVVALSGLSLADLRQLMLSLCYTIRLNKLQTRQTPAEFARMNKEGLVSQASKQQQKKKKKKKKQKKKKKKKKKKKNRG